jgi:hypothetical protein
MRTGGIPLGYIAGGDKEQLRSARRMQGPPERQPNHHSTRCDLRAGGTTAKGTSARARGRHQCGAEWEERWSGSAEGGVRPSSTCALSAQATSNTRVQPRQGTQDRRRRTTVSAKGYKEPQTGAKEWSGLQNRYSPVRFRPAPLCKSVTYLVPADGFRLRWAPIGHDSLSSPPSRFLPRRRASVCAPSRS